MSEQNRSNGPSTSELNRFRRVAATVTKQFTAGKDVDLKNQSLSSIAPSSVT